MLYRLLLALPLVFAADDGGKGGGADYKRNARKNANPDATVSCVLEADKSGAYRPECQEETIKCKQGQECLIQCMGRSDRCAGEGRRDCKPCFGSTFIGADGYDMTFSCEGDAACQDVTIQCPDHALCNVRLSGGNGDAMFGMKGAVIIGASDKGELRVENNQARSGMEDAQITCPENGKCYVVANEAYKETQYDHWQVISESASLDAYKGASINGSMSSALYVSTAGADRALQNANIFCPPRERNRGPGCEIAVSGGEAMLVAMHVHVAESIADVSIDCQYDEDVAAECYGDLSSSPYNDEDGSGAQTWQLSYQPTLDCGVQYGYAQKVMSDFDFDCLLYVDPESEGDAFTCADFEGESVCDAPEHTGGFCNYVGDEETRGEEDRMGSSCDRYNDADSCNAEYDCVWDAYADSNSLMAAAAVTVRNALSGNAASTLYLALSLVLFGSSAAVYYSVCMDKKVVERLAFEEDGVVELA